MTKYNLFENVSFSVIKIKNRLINMQNVCQTVEDGNNLIIYFLGGITTKIENYSLTDFYNDLKNTNQGER